MIHKGRCRHCDHLIVWDQDRYSKVNHVLHCKQCGKFLAGGFKCEKCGLAIAMMNQHEPGECFQCGAAYETPLRESI